MQLSEYQKTELIQAVQDQNMIEPELDIKIEVVHRHPQALNDFPPPAQMRILNDETPRYGVTIGNSKFIAISSVHGWITTPAAGLPEFQFPN